MLRRLIDISCSSILLLLASPVILVTALAIRLTDHGPVFYRQTRAGRRGCPFELLKFRSMRVNNLPAVVMGQVGTQHPMVTAVGKWLRRFKIDELPQLFNVLRGEMALIGPRPTVLEQVADYSPFQRRRLDVLPGMTGWAQVNGGVALTWPQRIMLDVWYVDHLSFWIDVKILWRTVGVVFFGEEPNLEALEAAIRHARAQEAGSSYASLRPHGLEANDALDF